MSAHTPGYEVTKDGRVFSIDSNWRGRGRFELAQGLNSYGYPSVRIMVAGKRKRMCVHVLVAMEFLVKPDGAHEVCHIDGDKTNNRVENLRWGTQRDNASDRERHGRTSRGEKHSAAIKKALPPPHNKGGHISDEQRQKISAAMKGQPWSAARRASHVL